MSREEKADLELLRLHSEAIKRRIAKRKLNRMATLAKNLKIQL